MSDLAKSKLEILTSHARGMAEKLAAAWLERRRRHEDEASLRRRFRPGSRHLEALMLQTLSQDAPPDEDEKAAQERRKRLEPLRAFLGFCRQNLQVPVEELARLVVGVEILAIDPGLEEVRIAAVHAPWLPRLIETHWTSRPPQLLQEGVPGLLKLSLSASARSFVHSRDYWLDPRNFERAWNLVTFVRSLLVVPVRAVGDDGRLVGFVGLLSPVENLFSGVEEELVELLDSYLTETWYLLRPGVEPGLGAESPWDENVRTEAILDEMLQRATDEPLVQNDTLATIASVWEWDPAAEAICYRSGRVHEQAIARRIEHLLRVGLADSGPWELPRSGDIAGDGRFTTQLTVEGLLGAAEKEAPRGHDDFLAAYRKLVVAEDGAQEIPAVHDYVEAWDGRNRHTRFETLAGALRAFQYGETKPIVDLFVPLLDLVEDGQGTHLQAQGILRFNCRRDPDHPEEHAAQMEALASCLTTQESIALLRRLAATLRLAGELGAELAPWLTPLEVRDETGRLLRSFLVGDERAKDELKLLRHALLNVSRIGCGRLAEAVTAFCNGQLELAAAAAVRLHSSTGRFIGSNGAGTAERRDRGGQFVVVLSLWLVHDDIWNRPRLAGSLDGELAGSWASSAAVELFPVYQVARNTARLLRAGLTDIDLGDCLPSGFVWEPRPSNRPEVLIAGVVHAFRPPQPGLLLPLAIVPARGVEVCRFAAVGEGALGATFMPRFEESPDDWDLDLEPEQDLLPKAHRDSRFHAAIFPLADSSPAQGFLGHLLGKDGTVPEVALGKAFGQSIGIFRLPAPDIDPRRGVRYTVFWQRQSVLEAERQEQAERRLATLYPFYNLSLFAFKERSFNETQLLSQWVHALALPLVRIRNQAHTLLVETDPERSHFLRRLHEQSRRAQEKSPQAILDTIDPGLLRDWLAADAGLTGLPGEPWDAAVSALGDHYLSLLDRCQLIDDLVAEQFRFTQAIVGFKKYAEEKGYERDYRNVPLEEREDLSDLAASALLTAWSQLLDLENLRYKEARKAFFPPEGIDKEAAERLKRRLAGSRRVAAVKVLNDLEEEYRQISPGGVGIERNLQSEAWLRRGSRHYYFVRVILEEALANAFRNIGASDGRAVIRFSVFDDGEVFAVNVENTVSRKETGRVGSSGTGQVLIENLLQATAGSQTESRRLCDWYRSTFRFRNLGRQGS